MAGARAAAPEAGPERLSLRRTAERVLTRPWLLWTLAAVFALRAAVLVVLAPDRPDARNWWFAARLLLTHPTAIYSRTAEYVAQHHHLIVPGTEGLFVGPPGQLALGVPFALFPEALGVQLMVVFDAAAAVAALVLLERVARPGGPSARALFWLLAAYFPPLFADLDAGQRGGSILLLAVGGMVLEASRPVAAGAFAGLAAAIKIYPAAMALGPDPRRRLRFAAGLAGSLLGSWALLSIPLGNPLVYLQGVLLPAAGATDADCGIASVTSFWRRTVGGEPYALPDPAGIRFVTLPLHLPELATALALLSAAAFAGAALWAAWRSGWHPAYGLALGFALGALIPGEVYPYQFLPLLPLALLVAVRAAEARRAAVLAVLLVALLGFVRQPCELPFPNLWSLAGVAVFAIGVWQYGLFRARPAAAAATVGGRVHGDQ